MTEYLVVGIAPTSDPTKLQELLANCNCEAERLATITKAGTMAGAYDHAMTPALSAASTIMTGSSGTGVPGIGGSRASLSGFGSRAAVPDFLGGLPLIPRGQAENYNIAISEGRALVTYKADPEEAANVEAAFRQAGLRNVKVFKP